MSAKLTTVILSLALIFTASVASAQMYSIQGPPPAGLGVAGAPAQGPSYVTAGPSMDPNMGMAPTAYGGPSYIGQPNYGPPSGMAPAGNSPMLMYGQLEVDYLSTVFKDKSLDPSNGVAISLMAELFNPFFLHFGVNFGSGSGKTFSTKNYDFSTITLGAGGYIALTNRFHVTGEVGFLYSSLSTSNSSVSFSDGAVYMMPGLRFAATDELEFDAHLTATSADNYDSMIFDVGGYYKLFSQMDLGLGMGFGDQSRTYKAGVRFRW